MSTVVPGQLQLPQLQDAFLDEATLEQLLQDIQRFTVVDQVLLKGGAMAMAPDTSLPLDEAMESFRQAKVLGVQIRYWFKGSNWRDTLLRTPQGIRLIRIEHQME